MYKIIVLVAILLMGAQFLCATNCIATTADFYVANYSGSAGCTIGVLLLLICYRSFSAGREEEQPSADFIPPA